MTIQWNGDKLKKRIRKAQITAINTTMAAAVLHAKRGHGPGAHSAGRFETQTGSLERSVRIVAGPAGRDRRDSSATCQTGQILMQALDNFAAGSRRRDRCPVSMTDGDNI